MYACTQVNVCLHASECMPARSSTAQWEVYLSRYVGESADFDALTEEKIWSVLNEHFADVPVTTRTAVRAMGERIVDTVAPKENLRQYGQRLVQHIQAAEARYNGAVQLFPEFTRRCMYIAGLPTEIQAYVTTQKFVPWDDPHLDVSEVQQLYQLAEEEFNLPLLRCSRRSLLS
eukprot:COSAG02_NODE_4140_length_5724_cov_12.520889_5_plen_174_part_00